MGEGGGKKITCSCGHKKGHQDVQLIVVLMGRRYLRVWGGREMMGCDFGLPWRRRETLDAVSLFHKEEDLRERERERH